MAAPARLKDRVFQLVCVAAALGVLVVGLSRGNARAGLIGAGVLLGYAVLAGVSRRLTPGARLLTGDEADHRERVAHYRATRAAGQTALVIAAAGVLAALVFDQVTGLWVAGATLAVLVSFVAALWWHARR